MMALRKISDVAVSSSAKQSTTLTRLRVAVLSRLSCHSITSVRILAGILPLARRVTAGQWMLRAQPCDGAAAGLGGGGIEQIRTDGCRRVDAKQQDQQRRHQRAAADAGHPDQQADAET